MQLSTVLTETCGSETRIVLNMLAMWTTESERGHRKKSCPFEVEKYEHGHSSWLAEHT